MKFRTVAELVEIAEKEGLKISEVMILHEIEVMNRPREEIFAGMEHNLTVMEQAIERGLTEEIRSHSGLTGGDARKINEYKENAPVLLSGSTILNAVSRATAVSEVNAAMGTIVATPTAGACGILPGAISTAAEKLGSDRETKVRALFTAGAIGFCIANNACIAGAAGGCQAEVGSATAMAAAAVVEMAGGTPTMSGEAVAIALKNMLGLVCDPVAGLVEAPCVKRNAMGAAIAMVAADMAMAGVKSIIPTDEVIGAMFKIGQMMPVALKETALGGLAATPTGQELERKIFGAGK
ncbi:MULTISPECIES: L-serine ammonia-lyase, iron-sulfur-dependent, subunit alpha [Thermoactinomyces]|jgi:L-serine dehydratase|uniref:L-serine dehydratase n=1 Tax=Thermoactinomyces daqus TaxID=1329516 RepID=A0A7W2AJN5_9BACL|nr:MULTISPECIES: L-serine ammonia-lyase, iron-sulfur-dependent, subunit alpha [Thermoactinomyces]MBA4544048.1 L-serine ammonia-lyase, iron-sulfur-dependent, subunit alpha [Thermoactinomyces daqus]MBH8598134.1 L-serine ammonia-lyase, iron-sulfur-dependent, subunit alpha [Thermoactinomyces sp. CICC 10523]MBH8603165.1 L-serine ammonia-lyase, iron-sulfur-dependent, subunit alpha [Thermoactinomyces sp. CICC 10522]MBH8607028.1 L-serine ammonia-lyase, iron-sulfur-dependent, subunit alpha [Thermoactino